MPSQREWDESCPHVWDQWQQNGCTWIVQDLPPEDDDKAVELMKINMIPDEALTQICGIKDDPAATAILCAAYKRFISYRTSLACYKVEGDKKVLVGLNICIIEEANSTWDTSEDTKEKNDRIDNLLHAVFYILSLHDDFKYLNVDTILSAIGLCVAREYRGSRLGARILNAREHLCRHLGIKATSTLFTGVGSQKLATRCGFTDLMDIKVAQLADAGIQPFSKDDDRIFKIMYKRFD